jgi:hypothetical protein
LRERLVGRGVGLSVGLLARTVSAAPVPAALLRAAVNAGVSVAAGSSDAVGVVSQQVITLAEGVLQTMWMSKFKTALLWVLVTGLVCSGLGGAAWYQSSQAQAQILLTTRIEEPIRAKLGGEQDQNKDLVERERRLKAAQEQLQEDQKRVSKLRQEEALEQIEAALKKLKQVDAGQPQRKGAIEVFEQAFGKLKQGLAQPEARDLGWVSRQMDAIKERLEMGSAGKKTQKMQEEILDRLDGMIKELETKQKIQEDPKLKDRIAEIKMIRAMQKRVNVRTELYGNQNKGEQVPRPETAKSPEEKEQFETLRRELKEIGNRQDKIGKIAQELARPKKDGRE